MRRNIIDMVVIVFAFLLFTIWYRNIIMDTVSATSLPQVKYYDVYLITPDREYQFWEFMNNGAADMAALTGVKYKWKASDERDPLKQMEVINDAVNEGADALLIAADDPKLIAGAVEDAKALGIKVVYVDAPANEEAITTLATENYKAGYTAGLKMVSNLESMGRKSGSIGIISVYDKSTTEQREEGFRAAFAEEPNYKVIQTVYTNGDTLGAQKAAERVIAENSDLVGLFGTNEGTSEGVGYAIKADDNKIVGVGFDKSDKTMKLLQDGSLKVIINQNPYTMGYLGMAEAVAAMLNKDTGPSNINTGYTVLEKE